MSEPINYPHSHGPGLARTIQCELPTSEVIRALCLARDYERDFGPGGHTTRATQDAAIAAIIERAPARK